MVIIIIVIAFVSHCHCHCYCQSLSLSLSLSFSLFLFLHVLVFVLVLGGGGGGGGGKYPRRFQLSRTSLIFKQYLPNVATFTKIYWRTRIQGYHMLPWQPHFRRHVYSNFDFLNIFLHLLTKYLKQGLIISL